MKSLLRFPKMGSSGRETDGANERRLILSVHIPKTGGSLLHAQLAARYGKALALYYGPDDPRTHPLARRPMDAFDAAMVTALEEAGIAVLHGHFRADAFAKVVPDPSRYAVTLREPIERTISHYFFFKKLGVTNQPISKAIQDGLSLEEFAARPWLKNFQTRHVAPFALEEFGSLAITERLAAMGAGRKGNVNTKKPIVDLSTRKTLARLLSEDLATYSLGLELCLNRADRSPHHQLALAKVEA